jgi:hypothetical protein
MTFSRVGCLLLSASVLTACSLGGPEPGTISLTLEVDRTSLPVGETMQITTTARNLGEQMITLTGPNDCLIYIEVFAQVGGSVYDSLDNCTGATVTENLAPGAERTQVFTWAGVSRFGTRLTSGPYTLRAIARVTGNHYSGPALQIQVE